MCYILVLFSNNSPKSHMKTFGIHLKIPQRVGIFLVEELQSLV